MSKIGKNFLGIGLLVLILCLGLIIAISSVEAAQSEKNTKNPGIEENAKKKVAEINNLAIDDLNIVNSASIDLPLTGKKVKNFKLADNNGNSYGIALDENGNVVDVEELISKEHAAKVTRNGKIEDALVEKLKTASPKETINVIIWVKLIEDNYFTLPDVDGKEISSTEEQTIDENFNEEELVALINKNNEKRSNSVKAATASIVDSLKKKGHKVETDEIVPMIAASLKPDEIRELSKLDEIDQIYTAPVFEPEMNVAGPTSNANLVYQRNIGGFGVKVGEIEVGGRVYPNTYLAPTIVTDLTYSCLSNHSTAVAGIINGWNPSYFGIAPGAWLRVGGSCNGTNAELTSRSTAAVSWGARILSMSWGANIGLIPGAMDRFYDTMVINNRVSVVKSAGNEGYPCRSGTGNISSPGLAYNIITVGNYDDKNTLSWIGDTMNPCSSWKDPISTYSDREKPEVAAPGSNITTTYFYSIMNAGSGTSFSAPIVTGEIAQLMNRQPVLKYYPEAVKAIVMTSAVHNIEGAARLSEYDGAGGIVADRADNIARGYDGYWGSIGYSCANPTLLNVTNMYLLNNTRTRAVIAWDNNPTYAFYASQPGADLDLRVIAPNNQVIAGSYSNDNNYEIVDFVPTKGTGYYKLQVSKYRCSQNPPYLGYAWRRGS